MTEYAENLPYFKTSNTAPDTWMAKASKEISKAGGLVLSEGFGSSSGESAFMLRFDIGGDSYRVVWPCAESKFTAEPKGFANASRRQAATMLYHDVKAMCVKSRALGAEVAFFSHLELPNGSVASEMVGGMGELPSLLGSGQ